MTAAEQLLPALRTRGIGVRLDGDTIRCKAPDGIVPADLAHQIRNLKPELVAELTIEADEVAWRVAQIGGDLLTDAADAEPGVCPTCWMVMSGRVGKCVRCCLAAAHLLDRRRIGAQTTYPLGGAVNRTFGGMSPAGSERAA